MFWHLKIDGLVQERRNSIANTIELRFSCTNPLEWSQEKFSQKYGCLNILEPGDAYNIFCNAGNTLSPLRCKAITWNSALSNDPLEQNSVNFESAYNIFYAVCQIPAILFRLHLVIFQHNKGLLIRCSWIMHLWPKRGTLGIPNLVLLPYGCI